MSQFLSEAHVQRFGPIDPCKVQQKLNFTFTTIVKPRLFKAFTVLDELKQLTPKEEII